MRKRSISTRLWSWLHDELQAWRAEAILSEEQAQRILDLYETSSESAERQRLRGIFTLMAVAGLLVGLAVLLLIGYNWEKMLAWQKLVIIFGVILGTYTGGFYLRYNRKAQTASELVFFLGCLFYGAGIWLVAQIFHLNAHYPDGIWWWALGVLPFALCLDTLLLHALLVALLAIWAGTEVLGFSDRGAWFFWIWRWDFVPNGAYTLPLLALPGFIWAYRKNSPTTVGLYAPLLAWWVILQLFAWRLETNPIYFIGAVGALFLLWGESHKLGSLFAIPYRLWGMLLTGSVLVLLSIYDFNKDMFRHGHAFDGFVQTLAILVLAVATVAATLLVQRRFGGDFIPFSVRVADLIQRESLPFVLVLFMLLLALWESIACSLGTRELTLTALVPTVLANVAMIGCAFWLIVVGLREDRTRPFAAGVFYFLLWAVLRYVDLFGDFGGMLGAALMFFLCGATLFGVALYWRQRKGVRHA
ncbi:MAG: DUF2157 domain-containing protein [Thermogemmata sp.]|jgi:uncharacterized membrane protein